MNDYGYICKRYKLFYDQNGYIPDIFQPYSNKEIKDISPTITASIGSGASIADILIKVVVNND